MEVERSAGWSVDSSDLWLEFKDFLLEAIGEIAASEKAGEATEEDSAIGALLAQRIDKVEANQNYYKTYLRGLMAFCECRYLKPQRLVNLTPAEEQIRAMNAWRLYDWMLWLCAFGSESALRP